MTASIDIKVTKEFDGMSWWIIIGGKRSKIRTHDEKLAHAYELVVKAALPTIAEVISEGLGSEDE